MTGVRVLAQGPHHAVLYKPAGMVVVAGRGVPRPTLLDVAIELFGQGVRPVHRIDRVTSGLCIVAKTAFGQQALSEAFRRHLVDKRYLCLVEGVPSWKKLDVDARLSRMDDPDARKGPMAWQTVDDAGVRALTRLAVLGTGDGCALLEARPETGRMHQIRCHAAHVGHPLWGDSMYGGKQRYPEDKAIALVAYAVSFPLPHGGRAFVVGDVPDTFSTLMKQRGISGAGIDELRARFEKSAQTQRPAPKPAAPPRSDHPRGKPGRAAKKRAPQDRATPRPPGHGPHGPRAQPKHQSSSSAGSARSGKAHRGDRRSR